MEKVYHIEVQNSVLLLNGSFVQSAHTVRYAHNEPLFITVLPLDAAFLPYTAEILDGKAVCNGTLARCCSLGDGHVFIELRPRSAFVYTPGTPLPVLPDSTPAQLLSFVQSGNMTAARSLLTSSLDGSLTDEGLRDFFQGVAGVRENVFTPRKGWLLLRDDGTAQICDIKFEGGRIDDIIMGDGGHC